MRDEHIASFAAYVAAEARAGDFNLLIGYIECGRLPLTPELRAVLVDILLGKVRRSRKRPKDVKAANRQGPLAAAVNRLVNRGEKVEAAVKAVADANRVSVRTVYAARAAYPHCR
jgi:hypothetical protein